MANKKDLKELEESIRAQESYRRHSSPSFVVKKERNELLEFFIGLILLGVGLFWLFQRATVSSGWLFSSGFHFGGINIPSGTVIIPFIVGVILLFFCDRRIYGLIVTSIGIAIIVLAIIMSVRIQFNRTTLFDFVLMFVAIASGTGLLLRSLFKKK